MWFLIFHCLSNRNHYIQAVYVIILSGIFVVFLREIYPRAKEYNLSTIHVISPFIGMVMNGLIFATCCWSDPGVIDRKNYEECSNVFTYDGVMYQEGVRCSTCEFVKPARSKHCGEQFTSRHFMQHLLTNNTFPSSVNKIAGTLLGWDSNPRSSGKYRV